MRLSIPQRLPPDRMNRPGGRNRTWEMSRVMELNGHLHLQPLLILFSLIREVTCGRVPNPVRSHCPVVGADQVTDHCIQTLP